MARKKATRKFQLTFNNPQTHGYTHERIRSILEQFSGLEYWCMCDETGEQGTPHTHLYMASRNAIQYDTIHRRFYGVHVEAANGTHRENRDYIRKEGKWLDDAKHETNHPETFEEWGELPPDKSKTETQAERIIQLVKDGKTNAEILEELPTAYNRLNYIEQSRQTLLEAQYRASGASCPWSTSGVKPAQERPAASWSSMAIPRFTGSRTTPTPSTTTRGRM